MTSLEVAPSAEQLESTLIGQGAQYKVYDIGDERVRKVPLTPDESLALVTSWYGDTPENHIEESEYVLSLRDSGAAYVQDLLQRVPHAAAFFGNPVFEADGSITQDKVEILVNRIETLDEKDQESLLEDCTDAIKTAWDLGMCDKVFNVLNNYGINESRQVLMIDFGEIITDKEAAIDIVRSHKWETSHDFVRAFTPEQRDYFQQLAASSLTPESLERHWQKALV